jgi:hypothetical protein
MLQSFSPFERYPYYQDQLPTIPYIISSLESSHEITEYNVKNKKASGNNLTVLYDNLQLYKSEEYRASIYPYNSNLYLSYLGVNKMSVDYLNLNGILSYKPEESFIVSPLYPTAWVKPIFSGKHLFTNKLKINKTETHILTHHTFIINYLVILKKRQIMVDMLVQHICY